jgi:type II secretory pathway component PulC
MATLGLREGDVIIKANNIELKSYKDAIDIYNGLDQLDAVQIVVLRENQEVELVYEIH